jgi:hypothetical protein
VNAGAQNSMKRLDSGFRRNDLKGIKCFFAISSIKKVRQRFVEAIVTVIVLSKHG